MSASAASLPPYSTSSMVIYVIWSSPYKCLTLAEICESLKDMFEEFPAPGTAKWGTCSASIRTSSSCRTHGRRPRSCGPSTSPWCRPLPSARGRRAKTPTTAGRSSSTSFWVCRRSSSLALCPRLPPLHPVSRPLSSASASIVSSARHGHPDRQRKCWKRTTLDVNLSVVCSIPPLTWVIPFMRFPTPPWKDSEDIPMCHRHRTAMISDILPALIRSPAWSSSTHPARPSNRNSPRTTSSPAWKNCSLFWSQVTSLTSWHQRSLELCPLPRATACRRWIPSRISSFPPSVQVTSSPSSSPTSGLLWTDMCRLLYGLICVEYYTQWIDIETVKFFFVQILFCKYAFKPLNQICIT